MWIRTRLLAAIAAASPAGLASAGTLVKSPFEGVTHSQTDVLIARGAGTAPMRINVAEFDLNAPGLSFRMTPKNTSSTVSENTLRTTTATANLYSANVAINASFYFYSDPASLTEGNGTNGLLNRGLVASNGDLYSPFERDGRPWPVVNISADNDVSIHQRIVPARPSGGARPINTNITPPISLYNAVSGSYQIVTNGANSTANPTTTYGEPAGSRARTGLGYTADGRLLMITIDEGSAGVSTGATWSELAEVMIQFGVLNGVNLDGGGSTTMAFRNAYGTTSNVAQRVNTLSGSVSERAVATHLMAYASPMSTPIDTFVYASFLLGDRGGFTSVPSVFGGVNSGILPTATTIQVVKTGETGERSYVQQLFIKDDPNNSADWRYRHLSNGGTFASNTARESAGWIGFWAKTDTPGVDALIALDESATTSELGVKQRLIADGEWHLYQWNLEDVAHWEVWAGVGSSNGQIDTATFRLDSLQFFGATDATIQIDQIVHNALGPIGPVPEPAALMVMTGAGVLLAGRRRH